MLKALHSQLPSVKFPAGSIIVPTAEVCASVKVYMRQYNLYAKASATESDPCKAYTLNDRLICGSFTFSNKTLCTLVFAKANKRVFKLFPCYAERASQAILGLAGSSFVTEEIHVGSNLEGLRYIHLSTEQLLSLSTEQGTCEKNKNKKKSDLLASINDQGVYLTSTPAEALLKCFKENESWINSALEFIEAFGFFSTVCNHATGHSLNASPSKLQRVLGVFMSRNPPESVFGLAKKQLDLSPDIVVSFDDNNSKQEATQPALQDKTATALRSEQLAKRLKDIQAVGVSQEVKVSDLTDVGFDDMTIYRCMLKNIHHGAYLMAFVPAANVGSYTLIPAGCSIIDMQLGEVHQGAMTRLEGLSYGNLYAVVNLFKSGINSLTYKARELLSPDVLATFGQVCVIERQLRMAASSALLRYVKLPEGQRSIDMLLSVRRTLSNSRTMRDLHTLIDETNPQSTLLASATFLKMAEQYSIDMTLKDSAKKVSNEDKVTEEIFGKIMSVVTSQDLADASAMRSVRALVQQNTTHVDGIATSLPVAQTC